MRSFAGVATLLELGEPLPEGAERLFSTDFDPTNSASPSARGALMVVSLDPTLGETDSLDAAMAVSDVVAGLDAEAAETGVDLVVFNNEILAVSMQEATEAELPRLLGFSLILIVGIMWLLFRRLSDVLIGLGGLLATLVWMNGFAVILGPSVLGWLGPFTQISTIIPVLLVGLGVDYAIHLTSRYREEQRHGLPPQFAGPMAVRTVGGALALATLTTMVGFLTNVVSPLPPVSDFGIFTAIGIASAFVVMTTAVPSARVLLDKRADRRRAAPPDADTDHSSNGSGPQTADAQKAGTSPPSQPSGSALSRAMAKTSFLAERVPVATLVVATVITLAAGVGATRLETSFNQDDFVPPDSFAGVTIDLINDVFGGDLTETTYVVIDGAVDTPEVTTAIDAAVTNLAGIPDVRTSADGAVVTALEPPPGLSIDGSGVALEVSTTAGPDRAEALADNLLEAMAPVGATGATVAVTSEPLVVLDTLAALTESQVRSIAITLGAAVLLLSLYFGIVERRSTLGLITMVPSLAVVLWILGTMWVLGLTINVLTAMIASLAIGIGVPFGIHVTNRFLEDRRRYGDTLVAIHQTVVHTGGAIAGSAATTAGGFGVLYFSSVLPIKQFGAIVAITIVYSLVAAVLVQPSCLLLWANRQPQPDREPSLRQHEQRPKVQGAEHPVGTR